MKHHKTELKKITMAVLLLLAAVFLVSCAKPAPTNISIAEGIVDSMAKSDFTAATADFDATMKSKLSSSKLNQGWTQMTKMFGQFKARTSSRETTEQGFKVVYVTCQFEKGNLDAKVAFDSKKKVAGLYIIPSKP